MNLNSPMKIRKLSVQFRGKGYCDWDNNAVMTTRLPMLDGRH